MQLKVLFLTHKRDARCQEYDKNNIHHWLQSDINDQGYQMIMVDKILN